jgi:hypothetical protein
MNMVEQLNFDFVGTPRKSGLWAKLPIVNLAPFPCLSVRIQQRAIVLKRTRSLMSSHSVVPPLGAGFGGKICT